jgi:hypothetical protein
MGFQVPRRLQICRSRLLSSRVSPIYVQAWCPRRSDAGKHGLQQVGHEISEVVGRTSRRLVPPMSHGELYLLPSDSVQIGGPPAAPTIFKLDLPCLVSSI